MEKLGLVLQNRGEMTVTMTTKTQDRHANRINHASATVAATAVLVSLLSS